MGHSLGSLTLLHVLHDACAALYHRNEIGQLCEASLHRLGFPGAHQLASDKSATDPRPLDSIAFIVSEPTRGMASIASRLASMPMWV